MVRYITVANEAEAEEVIERSRFIAHIKRVQSREDAEDFFASVRSKYKDATHNVPAFVIGEKQELQWASDDGEPSGTSGAPMLQMLVKEGLTNVAVIVTRYFGGVKLGTGGLVRAYTGVLRKALDKAGKYEERDYKSLRFRLPYSKLAKVQKSAGDLGFEIEDTVYEDELIITVKYESEREDSVIAGLTDMLSGSLVIMDDDRRTR